MHISGVEESRLLMNGDGGGDDELVFANRGECDFLDSDGTVVTNMANIEFRVPYSHRYLVLGLVGLIGLGSPLLLRLGLVRLALWLVSGMALKNYCCEYGSLNSMFARDISYIFSSQYNSVES